MSTTQLRRYAALCALACTLALAAPALAGALAAGDGSPLLIIALSIGGALAVVAAGLAGRQRNTRRHRRVAA
jgi:hypothetical protein